MWLAPCKVARATAVRVWYNDLTKEGNMTVQELIKKLQEFPPETLVRFTAEQGHIDTCMPIIEMSDRRDGDGHSSKLVVDLDG
jgi:hypothetical protein